MILIWSWFDHDSFMIWSLSDHNLIILLRVSWSNLLQPICFPNPPKQAGEDNIGNWVLDKLDLRAWRKEHQTFFVHFCLLENRWKSKDLQCVVQKRIKFVVLLATLDIFFNNFSNQKHTPYILVGFMRSFSSRKLGKI